MSVTKLTTSLFLLFFSLSLVSFGQSSTVSEEATGLPGDGFSLEGALDLFKQAESPEDFEKKLNTENYVNNLDLNEDGKIDFVSVKDYMEDEVHAIVLQVNLNAKEVQDIAVIELEKTGKEEATLQIIGDEDLYGEQVIVEPTEMSAKSTGKGPNLEMEFTRIIVNVWAWPSVRFVYRPAYRVYVSPYRWGYYPKIWWSPWRPRTWVTCHNYRVKHYRPHFHVVKTHRVVRAHRVYTPYRKSCAVVKTRTVKQVAVNKKAGRVVQGNRVVRKSTSTTVVAKTNKGAVVGKKTTTTKAANVNGKKVAGKKTTTTKVGKNKNGNVAAKKTTSTKRAATNGNRKAAQKKTTTKGMKKTKNGKVGAKKTTTKRRRGN